MSTNLPDRNIHLGLENIQKLCKALGNPDAQLLCPIHIAGTNGKGSTLSFLEKILTEFFIKEKNKKNFKIGKYTSPHLQCITERFTINGSKIPISTFENKYQNTKKTKKQNNIESTYFEDLTALVFDYFAKEQVDINLLETGLGGRLDATNIINPSLSLITNIGLDHQEYLGNTIEEIALEKAHIIKPGTPFITTATGVSYEIIKNYANSINAKEIPLTKHTINPNKLGLRGVHQIDNARLAITAAEYICNSIYKEAISNKTIDSAIYSEIQWPGRYETIIKNNKTIILDGAHNRESIKVLKRSLSQDFPNKNKTWLIGILKDKEYKSILNELFTGCSNQTIILTHPTEADLSTDLEKLKQHINHITNNTNTIYIEPNSPKAYKFLKDNINESNIGIVTGSLYLVGLIRRL